MAILLPQKKLQNGSMKILILSCNTGEGHNSSAKALKHHMDKSGIECEVKDTLSFAGSSISKRVSNLYNRSIQSELFHTLYSIGFWVSRHIRFTKSPIYAANYLYSDNLYKYIQQGGFDAIVSVHLFSAEVLTALKHKKNIKHPTLFVMTDYTTIPFLHETDLDRYIIPHKDLTEAFIDDGMSKNRLVVAGIPVNISQNQDKIAKSDARAIANKMFGWKSTYDSSHWYLIIGGSMGFGSSEQLLSELLAKIDDNDRIICVCGRNEEQQKRLTSLFSEIKEVKILGYSDSIPLLMDCCDVLFSKPGGITSTEALIRNIPLVHTAPIPGLEDKNAQFFHARGMSYYTQDLHQQVDVAIKLCRDMSFREQMLKSQRENSNSQTCEIIVNVLKGML